jgi:hypothetical protein
MITLEDDKCKVTKKNTCQTESSGGHEGALISIKSGYCAKITNKTELEFYRDIYKLNKPIKYHMPFFNGVCKFEGHPRIMVKNLNDGMNKPIEIDIKLGKYTAYLSELVDSGYSLIEAGVKTSRMRIVDNFTSSEQYNFVIVGGNFFDKSINNKSIQIMDPLYLLELFLSHDKTGKIRNIIKNKLKRIVKDLKATKYISLIGSSVYISYDKKEPSKNNIKLIDFAHSHVERIPHKSLDECLIGLNNLIKLI